MFRKDTSTITFIPKDAIKSAVNLAKTRVYLSGGYTIDYKNPETDDVNEPGVEAEQNHMGNK